MFIIVLASSGGIERKGKHSYGIQALSPSSFWRIHHGSNWGTLSVKAGESSFVLGKITAHSFEHEAAGCSNESTL